MGFGRLALFRRRVGRLLTVLAGKTPIPPGAVIGERVHLGHGLQIDWSHAHHVTIEDDAVLAPGVHLIAHDASSRRAAGVTWVAPVRIGAGAFIGAGSIVLPGVHVGAGAVVGAGSVVNRDVPPGRVWAGNPARDLCSADDLHARRQTMVREGAVILDERLYNMHPLQPALVDEMREIAESRAGYFLGTPDGET